jgi:D-lactate dehydrogenase (cytochrome)
MTSTGAAGTTTVRYGSMRENVLKLTGVLADGTVIHAGRETRKLSAGYDLTRLIVGSEGTLAIVTEITLRIFGIPEKMAAAVSRFPTLADGVQAAIAIVRSGVAIARCEFLDEQSIKNVNAHDGLTLQEAPTLLFEFHGSPRGVEEDAKVVQEITSDFGGTDFEWTTEEGQRRKLWQARHNAYWAGIAAFPGKRAISTDAAVPLSKLADAVAIAEKILKESPFPFSILGHVADGNFHTFIVTDPTKPEELDAIRELTHKTTSAIIAMGGTCTGEHGIGAGKIDSLLEEAGESSVAVMRSIKAALDPNGILNPGKIFS